MRTFLLLTTLLAQTMPARITRAPLLENDTVMMARLTMAPGAREEVHTHPFSAVIVQIDAGEVEARLGNQRRTARREPGHVHFIAAEMPHAAANAGRSAFDIVTVGLKPGRTRGGAQAPSESPAGITRAPLLDNSEARATRVTFEPGAREAVHSHPFDMVVVQVTRGTMDVHVGEKRETRDYDAGESVWLPRDVPHAISNAGDRAFTVVSIGVK
jgi:quercetin dioxygenase-like cupin family protein